MTGYDMKAASRSGKARHGWPTGGRSSAVPQLVLRPYGSACGPANAWNPSWRSTGFSGTVVVVGVAIFGGAAAAAGGVAQEE